MVQEEVLISANNSSYCIKWLQKKNNIVCIIPNRYKKSLLICGGGGRPQNHEIKLSIKCAPRTHRIKIDREFVCPSLSVYFWIVFSILPNIARVRARIPYILKGIYLLYICVHYDIYIYSLYHICGDIPNVVF